MVKRKSQISKDDGLVQTTIFSAFQNWKDLSIKRKCHKKYLKQTVGSGIVYDLCDELWDGAANMKLNKPVKLERKLAFPMSDSEDECENSKPSDVEYSKFKSKDDVNLEVRSETSINISNDAKIIIDEGNRKATNVIVKQHIIVTPKINRDTVENAGIEQVEVPVHAEKSNSNQRISVTPNKSVSAGQLVSPKLSKISARKSIFELTADESEKSIKKPEEKISPTKRTATSASPTETPTKNKSPKAVASTTKSKSPKKSKETINLDFLHLITDLFSSVYKSPYTKNIIQEESTLLKEFFLADAQYQFVCLKLSTWKHRWYNRHKFCKKIELVMSDYEVAEMYNFLADKGIVETDYSKEPLADLLNLLEAPDIKSVCNKFKLNKKVQKKENMINLIMDHTRTQSTLNFTKSTKDYVFEEVSKKLGVCFKLKESFRVAFMKAYILGTFVNPMFEDIWDFSRTMLNSNIVFPAFAVQDYAVFYSKAEFDRYVEAKKYRDNFNNAKLSKNHVEKLAIGKDIFKNVVELSSQPEDDDRYKDAPHLKRFSAKSVYVSTLSKIVKDLQAKYPEDVKGWLEFLIERVDSPHRIGDWYYHLTWLYMRHLKPINFEYAAELLMKVLMENGDTLTERQKYFLAERGENLKKSKKYRINQLYHDHISDLLPPPIDVEVFPKTVVDAKTLRTNEASKKRMYVVYDSEGNKTFMSVENVALEFYKEQCGYTEGQHCEGSLLKALFTLFFWDIIYDPETVVPGAFVSKLQNVPLDMFTTYFYTNRKKAIDKRLKDIERDWTYEEIVKFTKNKWNLHSHEHGFCEVGLYIENTTILENLIRCLGRNVLSKVFERIVKNIRHNCSGMPDLLVWNVADKKSKFVEVKGEGDDLSVTQKLWLKYLLSIGANAEICHVHSMGSKRKYEQKAEAEVPSTSKIK